MDDQLLVFVLGAPGAGKGTQCALIEQEFGWSHISAGDLLRAEVANGTPAGLEAEQYMKEGAMVPSSMIIGLLSNALNSGNHSKVLIDGFPRKVEQLREFEEKVRPCNTTLFYNVAEETARERLNLRSQSSGRVDDNEQTIRKRFVVFQEESMPVIDALREDGRVAEIDAAGSPEVVYAATKQVIEQLEQQLQQKQAAAALAELETAAASADGEATSAAAEPAAGVVAAVEESVVPVGEDAAAAVAAEGSAVAAEPAFAVSAEPSTASPEAAAAAPQAEVSTLAAESSETGATPAVAAVAAVVADGAEEKQETAAADVVVAAETPAATPAAADAAAPTPAAVPAPATNVMSLQMDLSGIRTPIVICGPSGVGKGTLINKLMGQYSDRFGFSVSHTTRTPRPGEQHGVHYYFTDLLAMKAQVAAGMFLEHAEVHGNMYGTSLAAVARVSAERKHCVLDIDVQGAQQVRASALGPQCLFIFIAPPSQEELERRLRNRGTEAEDKVLQRLENAQSEIAKAQEPGLFNHILVNGDLEVAYHQLQQLISQHVPGLLPELAQAPPPPAAAAAAAPVNTLPAATTAAGDGNATAALTELPLANGIAAAAAAGGVVQQQQPQVTVAGTGGTSTLLDFGFGASAGPQMAVKGMPVRQYMDVTVIPILREGLKALNAARPDDPLQYLADYLVAHKPVAH